MFKQRNFPPNNIVSYQRNTEVKLDELKIIIPSILVIVGWFASNWLATWRDARSKRIELRFKYLLDAHRAISSTAHRPESELTDSQRLAFETAVEDIQLLGNDLQLQRLSEVLDSTEKDFNKVLIAIRKELRGKIGLNENNIVSFYRIR